MQIAEHAENVRGGSILGIGFLRQASIKSAPDLSVRDASAALPQNCQTTKWIVEAPLFCVNVTLVIRISASVISRRRYEVSDNNVA
jgi:hypothetical protein